MLTKLIRGADHRAAPRFDMLCTAMLGYDKQSRFPASFLRASAGFKATQKPFGLDTRNLSKQPKGTKKKAKRQLVKTSSYYHTDFRRFVLSYMAMLMLLKRSAKLCLCSCCGYTTEWGANLKQKHMLANSLRGVLSCGWWRLIFNFIYYILSTAQASGTVTHRQTACVKKNASRWRNKKNNLRVIKVCVNAGWSTKLRLQY